jgi:hypothetical protein
VCGDAELAIAASLCGWDQATAEAQFDTFRDKALHHGWISYNWAAAWRTFCKRGLEYERNHPRQSETTAEKYSGLVKYVKAEEERKQTKH